MDSNHHRHQETTTTSKGEKKKKNQRERRHAAHTLWLTADPWEVRRRHSAAATSAKHRDRSVETKRPPSPTTSRWSWPAKPRSKTMTAAGAMRKEKAVCCIYSGDSVSATSVTSKPTTVRALWWRIVYWSGSLCLCEWFDIHAAFTSSWWEGKLLFLAHSLLALCVCVCVFIPHALGSVCSGGAHVTQLSYYVEASWRAVHKTVYTLQSLFI